MSLLERWFPGERLELDRTSRARLPGSFVSLSDGITHYEIAGPEGAPPIVLIHGFSVPLFIWDPTFEALAEAGFRVLRYDLYGRGYSDRPRRSNAAPLFVRQLTELLDALYIAQPVGIVSLSMGGVIAAEFLRRQPQRVRALSFLDPAGFDLELPLAVRLLNLPVLGELALGIFNRFGSRSLMMAMLSDFYQPSQAALDAFVPRYEAQMAYRGFKRSLLSTLRAGMLDEDLALFASVAAAGKPVQLIWGRQDRTVPFKHHERFLNLVPQTEFHAIERAGHIPHFEQTELVNPLLVDFLRRAYN